MNDDLDFTLPTDPDPMRRALWASEYLNRPSLVDFDCQGIGPDEQLSLPLDARAGADLVTGRFAVAVCRAGFCGWLSYVYRATVARPEDAALFELDDARYQAELCIAWASDGARICIVPEAARLLLVPVVGELYDHRAGPESVAARTRAVPRAYVEQLTAHLVHVRPETGQRVDALEFNCAMVS